MCANVYALMEAYPSYLAAKYLYNSLWLSAHLYVTQWGKWSVHLHICEALVNISFFIENIFFSAVDILVLFKSMDPPPKPVPNLTLQILGNASSPIAGTVILKPSIMQPPSSGIKDGTFFCLLF